MKETAKDGMPVLVFSHIEKTAGTSFRTLLWQNYGKENTFWYGINIPFDKALRPELLGKYRVVGGHFNLSDFNAADYPMLQLAFVRDPVVRAASLFRYYTQGTTEDHRRQWLRWGIRPDSLKASLDECPPFRKSVENFQCRRISGIGRFSSVLQHMESVPVLLAAHERLGEFVEEMASGLNWHHKEIGFENVAGDAYLDSVLSENGVRGAIESLNEEDRALHEWVLKQEVYGVLSQWPEYQTKLAPGHPVKKSYFLPEDLRSVSIKVQDAPIKISRGGTGRLEVAIVNESARLLRARGGFQVMLGLHWEQPPGRKLVHEGGRVYLPENVPPRSKRLLKVDFKVPGEIGEGRADMQLVLIQRTVAWLDTIDPSHCAVIPLEVS